MLKFINHIFVRKHGKYSLGNNPKALSLRSSGLFQSHSPHPVKVFFFILILSLNGSMKGQDSLLYQRITVRDTTLQVFSGLPAYQQTYPPEFHLQS